MNDNFTHRMLASIRDAGYATHVLDDQGSPASYALIGYDDRQGEINNLFLNKCENDDLQGEAWATELLLGDGWHLLVEDREGNLSSMSGDEALIRDAYRTIERAAVAGYRHESEDHH